MKISFITTVFNEEKSIGKLLESLNNQSLLPQEVIIVDGGSIDNTLSVISKFQFSIFKKTKVRVLVKKGNRSVGRNFAIENSTGDVIVCSDAGCILDKDWVKNITKSFKDKGVDVVAGYYKGRPKNVFEKCLVPYVLVMEDRFDPQNFLPATRSIAFKKSAWKKIGKFDERLSNNEDYVFARKLKEKGLTIEFVKDAIVFWKPRKNFRQAFNMFYRFAKGDAEAGILRPKVLLVFGRYFFALFFLFLCFLERSWLGLFIEMGIFVLYIAWAIKKNYKYVQRTQAIKFLPLIQLTADLAVLTGTTMGVVRIFSKKSMSKFLITNLFLIIVVLLYLALEFLIIRSGIPNSGRPYPFNMDEWHQFHGVLTTFAQGTPNTTGSANGTIFNFILAGLYLVPFTLLGIVNPIDLAINHSAARENLFLVLRTNTLIFGALGTFVIYELVKNFIKGDKNILLASFVFTPIWLVISNYFKYDIALLFWIILSMYFVLRFARYSTNQNFIIAGIPVAISLAVKISAIPLIPIYFLSYFWFKKEGINLKTLLISFTILFSFFLLLGTPDTLFGKGNIVRFLYENIIASPAASSNFQLSGSQYIYLWTRHYPIIFGHGLFILFIIAVLYWILFIMRSHERAFFNYKTELFIFLSIGVFALSLLPLKIYGGGNRSLVLLPFVAIIISFTFQKIKDSKSFFQKLLVPISIFFMVAQVLESLFWVRLKAIPSPQEVSSVWILGNIPSGSTIGIENVPIYQTLPDVVLKEYYYNQDGFGQQNKFKYQLINSQTKDFPEFVILTNDKIQAELIANSEKKEILGSLKKRNYKKVANFSYDTRFLKIGEEDFYLSWISAIPNNISVYQK